MNTWLQCEGIALCKRIETYCPNYGCHVALTGGLLYKDGERKDCDLLFYRIRQIPQIDMAGLITALRDTERCEIIGFGWCYKATFKNGKQADLFFPEEQGADCEYPEDEEVTL